MFSTYDGYHNLVEQAGTSLPLDCPLKGWRTLRDGTKLHIATVMESVMWPVTVKQLAPSWRLNVTGNDETPVKNASKFSNVCQLLFFAECSFEPYTLFSVHLTHRRIYFMSISQNYYLFSKDLKMVASFFFEKYLK
jgi:hypothetical protein